MSNMRKFTEGFLDQYYHCYWYDQGILGDSSELFKQLKDNVDRVKNLLGTFQDKMAIFKTFANDDQKATLNKIGGFVSAINDFQKNVSFLKKRKLPIKSSKINSFLKN